jgi:protein DJ-1
LPTNLLSILFQIDVTLAGVEGASPVVCSRNVVIKPDAALSDALSKDYDVVVCPGGAKGAEHLAAVSIFQF